MNSRMNCLQFEDGLLDWRCFKGLVACSRFIIIPVMQESSLQAKQQYLREKIIDAGHDPEQFVEFCSSKHNLDDLENWSMRELIDIVQAFLHQIHPQPSAQPPQHHHIASHVSNPVKNETHTSSIEQGGDKKMGLVLTDDDWSMLLSTPSIVPSKPEAQQANTQQNPLFNLDFAFPILDKPQQKPQPLSKDLPLSPPSTVQKPATSTVIEPEPQKPEVIEISLKEHLGPQKKSSKRLQSHTAINLSNVVLNTAKEKPLHPLPNIQEVTVSKTEQVARNFLQGDYTLYHITFSPCQLTIRRKFSDLIKLRGILQRLYPFLRLPYLEPEGWLSSSEGKDAETLAKYKWMVEEFVRFVILKSEELRQSEVVRFFCGLTKREYSKEEFRKKLEAYESVPRPKFVGELVLTNNAITIPPTAPADKFAIATSSLLAEIDVHYERLRRQLDYLFANYDLLLKSFADIGATFANIEALLNHHHADHDGPKEFGAFSNLQDMVMRLSVKASREAELFRSRIKSLFRYEKENMATLREVFNSSTPIHNQFARQGSPPLASNKVRAGNMEIDNPVPLEEPARNNKPILAVQEVFWSFAVRREGVRYWELLRRKINESLTLIAYDELDSENENLNFWNGIIKRCVL